MIYQTQLVLKPYTKGIHLITSDILKALPPLPEKGLINLFLMHTSAALALNENADVTVRYDMENFFNKLVPENKHLYRHSYESEDDMPAHIKSTIIGSSLTIPINDGKLMLGTWQGIYLCEFRNDGGPRKLFITVIG